MMKVIAKTHYNPIQLTITMYKGPSTKYQRRIKLKKLKEHVLEGQSLCKVEYDEEIDEFKVFVNQLMLVRFPGGSTMVDMIKTINEMKTQQMSERPYGRGKF